MLDVACGSGDIALALQKALPAAQITGLDFCGALLTQASARGVNQVVQGDALHLPFSDGSFSAVTLAFGLRNFADRSKALQEIHRTLLSGGLFALLEFTPPPYPWNLFWNFYLFHFMPWVAQLLTHQGESFRYLAESISRFPTPSALHLELHTAGLKLLFARSMSLGLVRLTICRKVS